MSTKLFPRHHDWQITGNYGRVLQNNKSGFFSEFSNVSVRRQTFPGLILEQEDNPKVFATLQ